MGILEVWYMWPYTIWSMNCSPLCKMQQVCSQKLRYLIDGIAYKTNFPLKLSNTFCHLPSWSFHNHFNN